MKRMDQGGGRSRRRPPAPLPRCTILAVAMQIAAGGGCVPPTLLDPDLRPVRRPAFLFPVPYGWAAVDTAAGRIRVIAELEVDGDPVGPGERWLSPALECPAKHLHRADRIRWDGPYCGPALDREDCPNGMACGLALGQRDRCIYFVRAEFSLMARPTVGDTLTLLAGGRRALRVLRRR